MTDHRNLTGLNPYVLAEEVFERSHRIKRTNALFVLGGIGVWLAGLAAVTFAGPAAAAGGLAASGLLGAGRTLVSLKQRHALRDEFNEACKIIHESAAPAMEKTKEIINREETFSFQAMKNHKLRTAWFGVCGMIAIVNPAAAVFLSGNTILDQENDQMAAINKSALEAREKLRSWKTGLVFD